MDDKKRIEGTVKKVDPDNLVVELNGKELKFPLENSDLKVGDRVFLRLFSEAEEKMSKEEIAKTLLNEVLHGGKE